jgi:flagellin-like protein
MNIKQLFQDEDAVSPVIGVILMVAITVILAAVIGTFVLGLGDQVQSSAPNANFQFEYDDSGDGFSNTNDQMEVTHNGGQDVEKSNVEIQVGDQTLAAGAIDDWGTTISTGSTETLNDGDSTASGGSLDMTSDETVRVVWTSPNGDSSNTIGSSTVPS